VPSGRRYVDEFILTVDDANDINEVFQCFNSVHEKIKFTKEYEDNSLAFLDVKIFKLSENIETTVYRKKTNIGAYTRWDSYVPIQYKQNLIWTLLHREATKN